MCFHDECVRPFDAWSHVPLTVVTEAFLPATNPAPTTDEHPHQVQINLRLSTGRDQVLLGFHTLDQVKTLADALSEMIASLTQVHETGLTGQPLLIAKTVSGLPTKL